MLQDAPKLARYRSSKHRFTKEQREAQETAVTALEPVLKPAVIQHDSTHIKRKRGAQKKVVADFDENDARADELGKYIQQGLSPMEAGLLARYSPEEIKDLQENSNVYRRYVENQLIKFKHKHLKVITDKPDAKTSQWLLERTFPHEFSPRRQTDPNGSGDRMVIAAIFKTIQETPDIPINTDYVDITHQKETEDDSPSSKPQQHQPSLEPGGANII